eukprot:8762272-Lingulodinium_polyedra.AAC.1
MPPSRGRGPAGPCRCCTTRLGSAAPRRRPGAPPARILGIAGTRSPSRPRWRAGSGSSAPALARRPRVGTGCRPWPPIGP